MSIMGEVNHTTNTSTEGVEEDSYVWMIPAAGIEVIDVLTGGDPGFPVKHPQIEL